MQTFRISSLSEYKRKKYLKARNEALSPCTSHNRFIQSFEQSNAPEWLKQRFSNLGSARNRNSTSGRPPDEGGDASY